MLQFQSQDDTGYLEIELEGSVFFRDRDGNEHYLQWEALNNDLQEFLSTFVDDAEAAFEEAIGTLLDAVPQDEDDEEDVEVD